jgi:glycosyltransferase involved in cell wall biosynthesis
VNIESPRVSVVVPVREDLRIDDLLESLAAQRGAPAFEVIVAIDGWNRLPRWPTGLAGRLLPGSPEGPYAARNRGISASRGRIVLLTDSDCLCPPDWVRIAATSFEDPTVQVLQGASLSADDTRLSLWIQREDERYVASHAATGYRRLCNTRSFGLRRDLAIALPFPEILPRGGDGVYGLHLATAGVEIRYEPSWRVFHRHRRSRWAEARVAFDQGRQGARWQTRGFDLFGESSRPTPRGPGAWLRRVLPGNRLSRRVAATGLLGVAAALGVASFLLPGEIGYRTFSLFRRAAHLAGRLEGESERQQDRPR